GQALAALAVGVGRLHVHAEALAGFLVHHRRLQARDDVAVADQDRQRLATLAGAFDRLLADFGNGVVETDDAVFFDLHAQLFSGCPLADVGTALPADGEAAIMAAVLRWRIIRAPCTSRQFSAAAAGGCRPCSPGS